MSVDIGLIGLPQSGKTTLANALTAGKIATESHTSHIGIAKVPEPRFTALTDLLNPKRIVPTEIRYFDIGASIKGQGKDRSMSSQFLTELNQVDALMNIIRTFPDETVPHIEGNIDPRRDIATVDLELAYHDIAIIKRRLEKIETGLKAAKPGERQAFSHELELLSKLKKELENDVPIRGLKLTDEEIKSIADYQFLTAKPMLIVINIGEEQLSQAKSLEDELNSAYSGSGRRVITLCGKLEMELSQLDDNAAAEFRSEFGIRESALDHAIKLSYELLGLISFFTIASGEIKCWPVPQGTDVLHAAGKIHTDMERGFIRAEVVGYDDLLKSGSLAEARNKGLLRLESKTYTVKDGDIITILFNV